MSIDTEVKLDTVEQLRADYFLERRVMGVINVEEKVLNY